MNTTQESGSMCKGELVEVLYKSLVLHVEEYWMELLSKILVLRII